MGNRYIKLFENFLNDDMLYFTVVDDKNIDSLSVNKIDNEDKDFKQYFIDTYSSLLADIK